MQDISAFFVQAIQTVHGELPWFFPLVGAVLGGVFGSLTTCLCARLPRGLSVRQPASQCDTCGYTLTLPDLIPVLSWVMYRGKCRKCGAPIGKWSLVLEVAFVSIGGACFAFWSPLLGAVVFVGSMLVCITLCVAVAVKVVRVKKVR